MKVEAQTFVVQGDAVPLGERHVRSKASAPVPTTGGRAAAARTVRSTPATTCFPYAATARLLRESDAPLTTVAARTGYGSE
ncbi:AraC family transcriptional regulator [Kitasatospora sp. Ki12]